MEDNVNKTIQVTVTVKNEVGVTLFNDSVSLTDAKNVALFNKGIELLALQAEEAVFKAAGGGFWEEGGAGFWE
jgi:hypothetical protein